MNTTNKGDAMKYARMLATMTIALILTGCLSVQRGDFRLTSIGLDTAGRAEYSRISSNGMESLVLDGTKNGSESTHTAANLIGAAIGAAAGPAAGIGIPAGAAAGGGLTELYQTAVDYLKKTKPAAQPEQEAKPAAQPEQPAAWDAYPAPAFFQHGTPEENTYRQAKIAEAKAAGKNALAVNLETIPGPELAIHLLRYYSNVDHGKTLPNSWHNQALAAGITKWRINLDTVQAKLPQVKDLFSGYEPNTVQFYTSTGLTAQQRTILDVDASGTKTTPAAIRAVP
jgi:hypothetical protein